MKFIAFLAAIAALVALCGQGAALGIAVLWPEKGDFVPHTLLAAAAGEMALYALLVILLIGFVFSRRRA